MNPDPKQLTALREQLRKDLEAIERVERLMAANNAATKPLDERQLSLGVSRTDVENADEDTEDTQTGSLRGAVEQIVNAEPSARWTTAKVLAKLRESNFPLRAKEPVYSVGQTLNVLVKKGKIRLARKGGGSTPNIYKGKSGETNSEVHSQTGGSTRYDLKLAN